MTSKTLSASQTHLTPTSITKNSVKINHATRKKLTYYSKLSTYGIFLRWKFTEIFLEIRKNCEHGVGYLCFLLRSYISDICYCCYLGVNNGMRGFVDWESSVGTKHQLTTFAGSHIRSVFRSREEPRVFADLGNPMASVPEINKKHDSSLERLNIRSRRGLFKNLSRKMAQKKATRELEEKLGIPLARLESSSNYQTQSSSNYQSQSSSSSRAHSPAKRSRSQEYQVALDRGVSPPTILIGTSSSDEDQAPQTRGEKLREAVRRKKAEKGKNDDNGAVGTVARNVPTPPATATHVKEIVNEAVKSLISEAGAGAGSGAKPKSKAKDPRKFVKSRDIGEHLAPISTTAAAEAAAQAAATGTDERAAARKIDEQIACLRKLSTEMKDDIQNLRSCVEQIFEDNHKLRSCVEKTFEIVKAQQINSSPKNDEQKST